MKLQGFFVLLVLASSPSFADTASSAVAGFSWFTVGRIDSTLSIVSKRLYGYKAGFVQETVGALSKMPKVEFAPGDKLPIGNEARLFAINALLVFFSDIQSEYLQTIVLPQYRRALELYNAKYGIQALRDFRKSEELISLALYMLKASLSAMKPFLTSEAHAEVHRSLIGATGRAIVPGRSQADLQEIGAIAASPEGQALLELLSVTPRTQGLALTARSLIAFVAE